MQSFETFSPTAPFKGSNIFVNESVTGVNGINYSFKPYSIFSHNVLIFQLCRVFWMVMCVIAAYLSCTMIHNSYMKWERDPVFVSLSEKSTPVWKIPFPAVTICPDVKASRSKINLTEIYQMVLKEFGTGAKNSSEIDICFGAIPKKK